MDQIVSLNDPRLDRLLEGKAGTRKPGWRPRLGSLLTAAGLLAVLAFASVYGHQYWTTGRFMVSTDDAYLAADSVIVSPRVSGYLVDVPVSDNEAVSAGQRLARIDQRDFLTSLAVAAADVDAQQASIDNLTQQIALQQLLVAEAHTNVDSDRAALAFSRQDYQRYTDLAQTGFGTRQRSQQATSDIAQKQASLLHDQTAVGASSKQIDVLMAQVAQARATLAQQRAMLHQAELNLSYTTITSPTEGEVGVRTLRVGQYVQAGTQLMAIVPLRAVYVVANYKETQLTDVHAGQVVTIGVDAFPDASVRGTVDSIAPASGQEFALLPPDNATGNFTKIVQRVPVKIRIDPGDPLIGRLRPGMSVEPTIDTRPIGTRPIDTRSGGRGAS
jgi:membrane fusion protein (multidrug efflux system)